MRVLTSVIFGFLFVMSVNNALLAQEPTRSVKDQTELSEAVNKVFSKKGCTQISKNSRDAGEAQHLSMTFRFRCEGGAADVSALLNQLVEVEGLTVKRVVKYPSVNSKNDSPSIDVRFNAIALTEIVSPRVPNSVEMTALAIRELPSVGDQLATPLPISKTLVLASPSQIYDSHKMTADGVVYTLGVSREGVLRYLETQDKSFATPDGVSMGMRFEDLERRFGSPILNERGFA